MKQLDLTYQPIYRSSPSAASMRGPAWRDAIRQSLRTIDPEVLEDIRRALLVAPERVQGDPVHYELAAPPS